jgi:hypothetical protein
MEQGLDEAARRIVEARRTLSYMEGLPEPGAPARSPRALRAGGRAEPLGRPHRRLEGRRHGKAEQEFRHR